MEGMVWNSPQYSETSLRPSKHVWAYGWHFLNSYVANPNSSDKEFNLPPVHPSPTTHPTHHPPHSPPICQLPIRATSDVTVVVKKSCSRFNSVSYKASRNAYIVIKHNLKDCLSYTIYPAWLQSSTRKPQWFQYFKLGFLEIQTVTIQLVFQNWVTYVCCIYLFKFPFHI